MNISSNELLYRAISIKTWGCDCLPVFGILTWNRPVSALACASVHGQSMVSSRKLGKLFSSWSHCMHLSSAHAAEFSLNFSSRCQARAWSSLQTAWTSLQQNRYLSLFIHVILQGIVIEKQWKCYFGSQVPYRKSQSVKKLTEYGLKCYGHGLVIIYQKC